MQKPNYNIAFFGTPELCIPILEALVDSGFTPKLVIANPDRPVGRKQVMTPPATKIWAEKNNIEIFQPEKLDDVVYEKLRATPWDLFIVVAYGRIMPERFIEIPKYGTLNMHYSLLPRWRGATPTEAAILAGDTDTGVTIQKMVYALDAGPIIAQQSHTLTGNETTPELRETLTQLGTELLVSTLPQYLAGTLTLTEQDTSSITKCGLTKKEDGEILSSDTDEIKWRKYRAFFGWPGTFFFDIDNKRVKITAEGGREQEYRA
jgi:methionyl-tRNA formyltransferase